MKYEKIITNVCIYYIEAHFLKECGLGQARILRLAVTILKHAIQHVKYT